MSKAYNRKPRQGVEPKAKMKAHIWGGHITLNELFVDGRLDDEGHPDTSVLDHLLKVARLKVINVFQMGVLIEKSKYSDPATLYTKAKSINDWFELRDEEMQKGQRRPRYTENNILGLDENLDELTEYIAQRIKGVYRFVAVKDLPQDYQVLVDHWRDIVRSSASRLLLGRAIEKMFAEGEIYYADDVGWQAVQSLVDDRKGLIHDLKGTHSKRRVPRNARPFHGRANTPANRKSQFHGGSVSNSKQ